MEWRRWQDLRDRVLAADGSIREVADVREAIQARGAEQRYLPPHSLDTTRSSRCSLS